MNEYMCWKQHVLDWWWWVELDPDSNTRYYVPGVHTLYLRSEYEWNIIWNLIVMISFRWREGGCLFCYSLELWRWNTILFRLLCYQDKLNLNREVSLMRIANYPRAKSKFPSSQLWESGLFFKIKGTLWLIMPKIRQKVQLKIQLHVPFMFYFSSKN